MTAVSRPRSLLTALFLVLAVATLAPHACAQAIHACTDQLRGNITYSTSAMRLLGGAITTCFSNAITGLSSVTSFTYYLESRDFATMSLSAVVFDSGPSNDVIASIDITDRLPTTTTTGEHAVTATFDEAAVALDPQRTYLLAFCVSVSSPTSYDLMLGEEAGALLVCISGCTAASATWVAYSDYVLKTNTSGSCPNPSASPTTSPSPSITPSASTSPSTSASPSASASPPAKGSAGRLTPGEALGPRAVRFVLSLSSLFA